MQRYKLDSAIAGINNTVFASKFNDRLSYVQTFDYLSMIPKPHTNQIDCVGMSSKLDYLIWREKNGFFTALDKKLNQLMTWSMVTGELLYNENLTQSGDK